MTKKSDLPKLDDWLAPWEQDKDGKEIPADDQKIDAAQLKRYLYGLLSDKNKLQTKVDEATTRAEELEKKVTDAPDATKFAELQQEVVKTRQERDEAQQKAERDGQSTVEVLRYRVALRKGLSEVQAKRLLGTSEEELEQDADELLASFGGGKNAKSDDDDSGDTVRRGPRRVLTTGVSDGDSGKDPKDEIDPDEWAAKVYAKRRR